MSLWKYGGWLLGATTALLGRRSIWICTEAVEETVHRHLHEQLAFLRGRDPALHAIIVSIQDEELAHLQEARDQKVTGWTRRLGFPLIAAATETLIWLSTWGDSSWMAREMKASGAS